MPTKYKNDAKVSIQLIGLARLVRLIFLRDMAVVENLLGKADQVSKGNFYYRLGSLGIDTGTISLTIEKRSGDGL